MQQGLTVLRRARCSERNRRWCLLLRRTGGAATLQSSVAAGERVTREGTDSSLTPNIAASTGRSPRKVAFLPLLASRCLTATGSSIVGSPKSPAPLNLRCHPVGCLVPVRGFPSPSSTHAAPHGYMPCTSGAVSAPTHAGAPLAAAAFGGGVRVSDFPSPHALSSVPFTSGSMQPRGPFAPPRAIDPEAFRSEIRERSESVRVTCSICLSSPVQAGRRFGILSGCDHPFCLECIRRWRHDQSAAAASTGTGGQARVCPVCRIRSNFVVPCDRLVVDPARKRALIQEYLSNVSRIPCRHFNWGQGVCPFGQACFYAHTDRNGRPIERGGAGSGGARRLRVGESGHVEAMSNSVSLMDFAKIKPARRKKGRRR